MRGGVSLAVWIGGAIAEIDLFRRACNGMNIGDDPTGERKKRADVYRDLLADTRYQKVEIDILAGASAGGLNAVLYGLAQSCNTVMDSTVHSTWITDGGIWELLRKPGFGRVPSILQGDERLFTIIRSALGTVAGENIPRARPEPNPDPPPQEPPANNQAVGKRIIVELAATLLDDPSAPNRANRARFSFARTPGSLQSGYSTIPGPPSPAATEREGWERSVALDRMALAARATSSFPGAFEPAEISSVSSGVCLPGKNAPLPPDYLRPPRTAVNMARTFLYARAQGAVCPEPFHVVDGGVFDNIPIDRAIRAIQRAPATQPCERVLIYLDPEPPAASNPVANPGSGVSAVSWIPVIRRSLTLKQRDETEGEELSLVRQHNDSVMETRGRLEALAATLRAFGASTIATKDKPRSLRELAAGTDQFIQTLISDEAYLQCRIAADGPRLGRLLAEPSSELCYPPREAADYVPLAPSEAVDLRAKLIEVYNTPLYWDLATDVPAMLDWVRVLLAWIHALEDVANDFLERDKQREEQLVADDAFSEDSRLAIGELVRRLKPRLYRWLTVLTEARHRTVDQVLAEPLRREQRDAGRNYPWSVQLHISRNKQRALQLTPELEDLLGRDTGPNDGDVEFYRLLSAPDQFCSAGTASKRNFSTIVAASLNGILDQLREESAPLAQNLAGAYDDLASRADKPVIPLWLAYWSESVYPHLYRAPFYYPSGEKPWSLQITDLSKLFAITGVPDTASTIDYGRITSRERPRFSLPVLRQAAKVAQLSSWLRELPDDDATLLQVLARDPSRLEPSDKLAGNSLSRFGGFFLGRWRENDWWWGRLDGAVGIVKIVERTRRGEPTPDKVTQSEAWKELLQTSLVKESAGESPKDELTIVETAGGDSFEAISAHYRFALASRMAPLVYRASWPTRSSPISLSGAVSRLGNILLRPLAVPVPLVVDPVRLALALVVILLCASLLGASATGPAWRGFVVMFFLSLAATIAIRTAKAGTSWRSLKRRLAALHTAHPALYIKSEWIDPILGPARNSRYRQLSWVLVAITAILPLALGAVAGINIGLSPCTVESFFAAAAAVLGLQHWLNQRAYKLTTAGKARLSVRTVLAVVAAGGAAAVVTASTAATGTDPSISPQLIPSWLHGWDDSLSKVVVASAAVALLTAISLWGWVDDHWAVSAVVVAAVVGGGVQWALDAAVCSTENSGLWDILPVLVWMMLLGGIVAWLPHRTDRYGEPTRPPVATESNSESAPESTPPNTPPDLPTDTTAGAPVI